jgi:hypothetical protein
MLPITRKHPSLPKAPALPPVLKQNMAAPVAPATDPRKKPLKLLFLLLYMVKLTLRN